ncbi:PhzF family phenazine biosynthesis protein [Motilimonas pumila]|uniref:PhzF family phenazine biosynthesis protein n=1 Tax=Motilimonas pumila TaxID=2303987 RepID=A0A418YB72_9GAMM|nr:PhzF family phenazine biosynthesis protein [Motilimonas pumila]
MYQVDAFTTSVFSGNYAAVVPLTSWLAEATMQAIAAENNVSETAFTVPRNEPGHYDIRWFSPLAEIDFCGHATLASAKVLMTEQGSLNTLYFHAPAVGALAVEQDSTGLITMTFPNQMPQTVAQPPAQLLAALATAPRQVMKNRQAYFAIYDQQQQVEQCQPKLDLLRQLAPLDVVVTAPANQDSEADFVSRYFWPANGGDEDQVTGSIHTGLAPYWAQQLGKDTLTAQQLSSRGGTLYCQVKGQHVLISGYGVLYLSGTIQVPQHTTANEGNKAVR